MLRPGRYLFVLTVLLLAFVPGTAKADRPLTIAVRYSAGAIAGDALEATFRVPGSIGRGATARLERRQGARWVTAAKGRASPGKLLRLRFEVPAQASSLVLRLRVLRGQEVLAASRRRTIRLQQLRPAASSRPQPAPGGGPPQPAPTPTAPKPLSLIGAETVLAPGSVATIVVPQPIESISALELSQPSDGISVVKQAGAFALAANADASPGARALELAGVGCTSNDCATAFELKLAVRVRTLAAPDGVLDGFTSPSPDRIAAGTPIGAGAVELGDQLNVTLGTPDVVGTRFDAEQIAAAVDGTVSGGLESLGVYEIRWTTPQDLDARTSELEAFPGVTAVSRAMPGLTTANAEPPGDWDDDGPQATWPFTQVRAQQAWGSSTGSNVKVGIVDGGLVYRKHEDLDVVESIGGGNAASHATHVAGLACAKANGKGVVGMAWGCPIVTAGIGDGSPTSVLEAATKVAESGAKVVNMSLGYQNGSFCHSESEQADLILRALNDKAAFRQLFQGPVGRGVVWTIAAGNNCAKGVPSPWGLNGALPNVLTVGATNDDGSLASFSDFGPSVEIAAPGGVSTGDVGLWSTWVEGCLVVFTCGSYATDSGTSMAAPVVAGIAALVRDAHPQYGAAEAAACLDQTAGEVVGWAQSQSSRPANRDPIVPFSSTEDRVPIVNAEAAVACATFDSEASGSYVGSWVRGGWLLDIFEESDGVLGAINQSSTSFGNGCVVGPGLKIMTGMTSSGTGQWNGYVAAAPSSCSPIVYIAPMALRAVRLDGQINLVLAWAQTTAGTQPTIDDEGNITSSSPYYSLRLTRPGAQAFDLQTETARKATVPTSSSHTPRP